jgi:hypothetical protein
MKPVAQTRTGWPLGNCWEAALASILGCSLAAVPDGRLSPEYQNFEKRYARTRSWILHEYGLLLVWLDGDYAMGHIPAGVEHILSVLTTPEYGSLPHAVVAKDGEVIHNPHPGRHGWGWRGVAGVRGAELLVPMMLLPSETTRWTAAAEWDALDLPEDPDTIRRALAAEEGL